jgi:hypothetical protein
MKSTLLAAAVWFAWIFGAASVRPACLIVVVRHKFIAIVPGTQG